MSRVFLTQPRAQTVVFRTRGVALTALLAAIACPAHAADPKKAARSLSEEALHAYEAGQHTRAAELYGQAYRIDPATPAYLYAGARALHVGGQLDDAEARYQQWLALPAPDATMAAKVTGYLTEVGALIEKRLATEAEEAERRADPVLAYARWSALLKRNPASAAHWLRAGEAARLGGLAAEAAAAYRECLARAAPDAMDRKVADSRLRELETGVKAGPAAHANGPAVPGDPTAAPVGAGPGGQASTPIVATAPATTTAAPAGVGAAPWIVTGVGAALSMGGLALWVQLLGEKSDFKAQMKPGFDGGQAVGYATRADAIAESKRIGQAETLAAIVGFSGAGTVVAGLAWRWLGGSSPTAAAPVVAMDGRQVALGWSF